MAQKIRNVLKDPLEESICLKDIIDLAVSMNLSCSKLEFENNKSACDDLKKRIRDLKRKVIEFDKRVRVDISNEIIAAKSAEKNK